MRFTISDEVRILGVRGIYLRAVDLENRLSDPDVDALIDAALARIRDGLSSESIESNAVLAGFRQLHNAVGRSNKKNVSSPENMLRMLLERGSFPRINLLVDIYNLVSLETLLALGAHDVAHITGNVTLRLTNGTESFVPLGATVNKGVSAGEYSYVDDGNNVICRLEVRQVEQTKVGLDTTDCFYIIQGNRATSAELLHEAAARLKELTCQHCGGWFSTVGDSTA